MLDILILREWQVLLKWVVVVASLGVLEAGRHLQTGRGFSVIVISLLDLVKLNVRLEVSGFERLRRAWTIYLLR